MAQATHPESVDIARTDIEITVQSSASDDITGSWEQTEWETNEAREKRLTAGSAYRRERSFATVESSDISESPPRLHSFPEFKEEQPESTITSFFGGFAKSFLKGGGFSGKLLSSSPPPVPPASTSSSAGSAARRRTGAVMFESQDESASEPQSSAAAAPMDSRPSRAGTFSSNASSLPPAAAADSGISEPSPSSSQRSVFRASAPIAAIRKISSASSFGSSPGDIMDDNATLEHTDANMDRFIKRVTVLKKSSKKSGSTKYWMPDSSATECYDCHKPFTKIRRRHHCRVCGNIFCHDCCNSYLPVRGKEYPAAKSVERTCKFCLEISKNVMGSASDSGPDWSDSGEAAASFTSSTNTETNLISPINVRKIVDASRKRSFSLFSDNNKQPKSQSLARNLEENRLHSGRLNVDNCLDDLKAIWREMMDIEKGLRFQPLRVRLKTHRETISGRAIVDWLREKEKISQRLQGECIGQALLDANFLAPLTLQTRDFKDSVSVYFVQGTNAYTLNRRGSVQKGNQRRYGLDSNEPQWVQNVNMYDHGTLSGSGDSSRSTIQEGRVGSDGNLNTLTSGDSTRSSLSGLEDSFERSGFSSAPTGSGPFNEFSDIDSTDAHEDLFFPNDVEFPGPDQIPALAEGVDTLTSERSAEHFKNSYIVHLVVFLYQLLIRHNVSFHWANLILSFARKVADSVRPNLRKGDFMDIRRYVKIKSIPGGHRSESRIINGVAFTGNVTDKLMEAAVTGGGGIDGPINVLLSYGSIECNSYRNPSGDPLRLVQFSTLQLQEEKYYLNCLDRMMSLTPSVNMVLMEFGVAQPVRHMLLDHMHHTGERVSVIENVKKVNLRRLARVLECGIAERIDNITAGAHHNSVTSSPKLGQCRNFHIERYTVGRRNVSLAVFEDCPADLFATIILRGSEDVRELRTVKHVLLEMIYASYNRVLERTYLVSASGQLGSAVSLSPLFTPQVADFTREYLKLSEGQLATVLKNYPSLEQPPRRFGHNRARAASVTCALMEKAALLEPHESSKFEIYREQFRTVLLSISPHVTIFCPFFESILGHQSPLRPILVDEGQSKYWSGSFPGEQGLPPLLKYDLINMEEAFLDIEMKPFDKTGIFDPENVVEREKHPFLNMVITETPDSDHFRTVVADFRLYGPSVVFNGLDEICARHNERLNAKMRHYKEKRQQMEMYEARRRLQPDCLDYTYHQRITVLSTLYATKSQCFSKWYTEFPFYLERDVSLGQFLERQCFKERTCTECEVSCFNHVRKFVYGHFCLHITVHPYNPANVVGQAAAAGGGAQESSKIIRMWNFCPQCRQISRINSVSENIWNYSFGKFLENALSACPIEVNHVPSNTCSHSLFRDHHQYFMLGKKVAAFRVVPINIYEISFPSRIDPAGVLNYSSKTFADEQKIVQASLVESFNMVSSKLDAVEKFLRDSPETYRQANPKRYDAYKKLGASHAQLKLELDADKVKYLDLHEQKVEQCRELEQAYIEPVRIVPGRCPPAQHCCSMDQTRIDYIFHIKRQHCEFIDSWNSKLAALSNEERTFRPFYSKDMAKVSPASIPEIATNPDSAAASSLQQSSTVPIFSAGTPHDSSNMLAVEAGIGPGAAAANLEQSVSLGMMAGIAQLTPGNSYQDPAGGFPASQGTDGHGICINFASEADAAQAVTSPDRFPSLTATVDDGIATKYDIGERVFVTIDDQQLLGTLKWVGFSKDIASENDVELAGIEFEDATNFGEVRQTYFECEPGKGLFVPLSQVRLAKSRGASIATNAEATIAPKTKLDKLKSDIAHLLSKNDQFIACPYPNDLHYLLPVENIPVLIKDLEPATIIAYSLTSNYYKQKFKEIEREYSNGGAGGPRDVIRSPIPSLSNLSESNSEAVNDSPNNTRSEAMVHLQRDGVFFTTGEEDSEYVPSSGAKQPAAAADYTSAPEGSPAAVATAPASSNGSNLPQVGVGKSKTTEKGKVFIDHNFTSPGQRDWFFCKTYYPLEFKKLRKKSFETKNGEDFETAFIQALSQSPPISVKAGRSNASFFQTLNKQFIVKAIKPMEMSDFTDPGFAHNYFNYLFDCLDRNLPSAIGKIYGAYKVSFKNMSLDKTKTMEFIVMDDVFFGRSINRKFDLKGVYKPMTSSDVPYRRLVEQQGIILDQHMHQVIKEAPIYVRPHAKEALLRVIERDAKFLSDNKRIDYSLLLGQDDNTMEIAVGIVDYVRKFGLDKKLEMIYKYTANAYKRKQHEDIMPTIVNPNLYYERFVTSMNRYLFSVPDRWYQLECGDSKWTCAEDDKRFHEQASNELSQIANASLNHLPMQPDPRQVLGAAGVNLGVTAEGSLLSSQNKPLRNNSSSRISANLL